MDPVGDSAVRVMSALPGRVRLRGVGAEGRRRLVDLAEELRASPELAEVEVRERSASIVVHFDRAQAGAAADRLLDLGVDLRTGARSGGRTEPATVVTAAAASANDAVRRRLDGTDLRTLVPLGLGLMAARAALRGDHRLADAPWYVLAWYASETFWKFHLGDGEEE